MLMLHPSAICISTAPGARRSGPSGYGSYRVDALLVTGDIADHGTEAEYEEAARLFGRRERGAPFPRTHLPGQPRQPSALPQGPARAARVGGAGREQRPRLRRRRRPDGRLQHPGPGRRRAWTGDVHPDSTLDELYGTVTALLAFHHLRVALHHPPPS